MKRSALVPIKDHPGLFAVLSPEAAKYLAIIRAAVIVDHARNLHYLTQARVKQSMFQRDPDARIVEIHVDPTGVLVSFHDDPDG